MKNYVKPQVSFQFFNLATTTSGGCNVTGTAAEYVCAVEVPGLPGEMIFTDDRHGCDFITDSPDEFGICYNVPVGDTRVLGS